MSRHGAAVKARGWVEESTGCGSQIGVSSAKKTKPLITNKSVSQPHLTICKAPTNKQSPKKVAKPAKAKALTPKTRRELILRHREDAQRMARSMMRKWHAKIEREELDSAVDLGLCEAAMAFDPSRGVLFTTFLYYHLKGRIVQLITTRANSKKIALLLRTGICGEAISEEDQPEGGWMSLNCGQCAPGTQCHCNVILPDEQVLRAQIIQRSLGVCQELKGVEREVMLSLYVDGKDVREITGELGYSRSHISRIRMRAISKVRNAIGLEAMGIAA